MYWEFIQIAYVCTIPLFLWLLLVDARRTILYRNLIAVTNLLLIGNSFFLIRQLVGLFQLSSFLHIEQRPEMAGLDLPLIRLLAIMVFPLFTPIKKVRESMVYTGIVVTLLYWNSPVSNWNLYLLWIKVPAYISLFCSAYALLWLFNGLPDSTPNRYMYSPVQIGLRYLRYYLTASNGKGHGVHSPFVYSFISQVLNDNRNFYAFSGIEIQRELLLHDKDMLLIDDYGAGSKAGKKSVRRIKDIASSSLKPKKFSQLLFRIVDHYAPDTILELGTSLGITTSYLASAKISSKVITMEGAPTVAGKARELFAKLGLQNIALVEGNFDQTLKPTLAETGKVDLAFVDGNHQYEPTVRYYRELLPYLHDYSILIFDDIHWSCEMEQAWEEILHDPAVTLSIDLFFIGLVFFRKEQIIKQHFSIRF